MKEGAQKLTNWKSFHGPCHLMSEYCKCGNGGATLIFALQEACYEFINMRK